MSKRRARTPKAAQEAQPEPGQPDGQGAPEAPPEDQAEIPPEVPQDKDPPQQDPQAIRDTWWPPVADAEAARKVARYGFWAAVVNIVIPTAATAILAVSGADAKPIEPRLLIEAGLFVPIAIGLYFYSRIAAVAAMAVYVGARVLSWTVLSVEPDTSSYLIGAVFVFFFIHGIRGTFALHRPRGDES